MTNKVDDLLTYVGHMEDGPFLRTKLLNVNMRLMKSSPRYCALIEALCEYLHDVSLMDLEGYGHPWGMSGANLGIPFNIIAVVRNRATPQAYCRLMINPRIIEMAGKLDYASSNCGSIRLDKAVDVLRYERICVSYWDEQGLPHKRWFDKEDGSYTIQHEVDHNLGILITDYSRVIRHVDRAKEADIELSATAD